MIDMWAFSDRAGLIVVEHTGEHTSGYEPGSNHVHLSPGLRPRVARSVLAHENAHHALGHRPTTDPVSRAKQELAANRWAAELLITPDRYAAAEAAHNGHVRSMAVALHVADELVLTYRGMLERLGGSTYVRPRMGIGQWSFKTAA